MKIISDLHEELRLLYNKIRVWLLKRFTDRVRKIVIEDPATGKKIEATTISEEQKVCPHNRIRQVYGTFWRCMDCPDVFFEITYKVALMPPDVEGFIKAMTEELQVEVVKAGGEHDRD